MKKLSVVFFILLANVSCSSLVYQPDRVKKWPDLGVRIAVISVPDANGSQLRRDFLIRAVRPDTPAAFGGIEAGDLLIALDETPINAVSRAVEIMQGKSRFDTLLVTIERDGERQDLLISLANAKMRSDI